MIISAWCSEFTELAARTDDDLAFRETETLTEGLLQVFP